MAMEVCNAPETFKTLMNQVFHEFTDEFVIVYIKNFLISSKDLESHFNQLEVVLHGFVTMICMNLQRSVFS